MTATAADPRAANARYLRLLGEREAQARAQVVEGDVRKRWTPDWLIVFGVRPWELYDLLPSEILACERRLKQIAEAQAKAQHG